MQKKRCVIVGNKDTGKSCLVAVYQNQPFNEQYIPSTEYQLNETEQLDIWDGSGTAPKEQIDFFIVTYAMNNQNSLDKAYEYIELCKLASRPILLAGTKSDLGQIEPAKNKLKKLQTYNNQFSVKINTVFFKTSAKNNLNVQELFNQGPVLSDRNLNDDTELDEFSVGSTQFKLYKALIAAAVVFAILLLAALAIFTWGMIGLAAAVVTTAAIIKTVVGGGVVLGCGVGAGLCGFFAHKEKERESRTYHLEIDEDSQEFGN